MPDVTIVYWRDIPAQVIVGKGRTGAKVKLTERFEQAIDRCAMKISTDAVLLGTLVKSDAPKQILDIGTGTGVIALMLAQRFPQASLTAIELDPEAAGQAAENCEQSPFSERLTVIQGRFQDFKEEKRFDLLVSNPPFFPDHLPASDPKRNQALHTHSFYTRQVNSLHHQVLSGLFYLQGKCRIFSNAQKEMGSF